MRFYTERCEAMRNFANKIWNATRFLMMNLTIEDNALPEQLELEDKWILSKLNTVIREVTENMDHYELGVAAQKLYDFIWDTYCDWYIELTKARLRGTTTPPPREQAQQVLCYVLTDILKLLHPFMPFLTEEIWQALPHEAGNEVKFLMLQSWPQYRQDLAFPRRREAMELLMDAVKAVRARRSEMNVPPPRRPTSPSPPGEQDIFAAGIPFLKRLGYASGSPSPAPAAWAVTKEEAARGVVTVITHAARIGMPLAELVDLEKEKARIAKELKKNKGELEKLNNKLSNPGFLAKAPENVVKAEQERAEKLAALIAQLQEQAASL